MSNRFSKKKYGQLRHTAVTFGLHLEHLCLTVTTPKGVTTMRASIPLVLYELHGHHRPQHQKEDHLVTHFANLYWSQIVEQLDKPGEIQPKSLLAQKYALMKTHGLEPLALWIQQRLATHLTQYLLT